jgi:hypothetical protein
VSLLIQRLGVLHVLHPVHPPHVVICAGQESFTAMYDQLKTDGKNVHLIGGAKEAGELDAKRAISYNLTKEVTGISL